MSLLLAVLEKRAGLVLVGDDVFVNIAGGMTVDEPAADLGVLAAIASSVRNRVIPAATAMFGEVGLAGEIRGITQAEFASHPIRATMGQWTRRGASSSSAAASSAVQSPLLSASGRLAKTS